MKNININIPKGYEIDIENSTFDCIKFKKIQETIIKWNEEHFAVEIKDKGMHFLINAQPNQMMSWHDVVRFYKDDKVWQLPTCEHLKLIAKYINKVNALIKVNGGYEIQGWYWSADDFDELCAWYVDMYNGETFSDTKDEYSYVRTVSAF